MQKVYVPRAGITMPCCGIMQNRYYCADRKQKAPDDECRFAMLCDGRGCSKQDQLALVVVRRSAEGKVGKVGNSWWEDSTPGLGTSAATVRLSLPKRASHFSSSDRDAIHRAAAACACAQPTGSQLASVLGRGCRACRLH